MDNQKQDNKQTEEWNTKLRLEMWSCYLAAGSVPEESVYTHQQILKV